MPSGIELTVMWVDAHLQSVKMKAYSPTFGGMADVYVGHDAFSEAAEALRGFPDEMGDARHLDFGTFTPGLGAMSLRFYCEGRAVRAFVTARVQSEQENRPQSAEVMFAVEAAAVDSFVEQLRLLKGEGSVALLLGADV